MLENTQTFGLCGNPTQKRFVNLIKIINRNCIKILQLAYKGDSYNATSLLLKLMTKQKYTKNCLADKYMNYLKFELDDERIYYRCLRMESDKIPQNCNHLPYKLRCHAIANRFNQTSFPCLYLASSLAIAKKEAVCNDKNNIYIGEFKAKRKLLYLNFCVPTKEEIDNMTE